MELVNSAAFSGVCYFLASVFVITGFLTLWSFRLLPGSITSLTRQRSIHICAILVAICRAVFFFLVPSWEGIMFYIRMSPSPDTTSIMLYILEEIPSVIFVVLFSLQLLGWGLSYYTGISAVHIYHTKMRPIVRNSIWALIALQLFIWISYSVTVGPKTKFRLDPDIWSLAGAVLHSVAFLTGAIVMLIYGRLVYKNISQVPVALEVRNRQMNKISLVTAVCTIAFLIRMIGIVIASVMAFVDIGEFTDNSSFFALCFALLFFLTTELLPLGVLLHFQGEFRRVRIQRSRFEGFPQFSKGLFANFKTGIPYSSSNRHAIYSKGPRSLYSRITNFLLRKKLGRGHSDPEQQPLVTSSAPSYQSNWQTFSPTVHTVHTVHTHTHTTAPDTPDRPGTVPLPAAPHPLQPPQSSSTRRGSSATTDASDHAPGTSPGTAPPARAARRPIASVTRHPAPPSGSLASASSGVAGVGAAHHQPHPHPLLRGPAPELVPGTPLFARAIEMGAASSEWVDPSMSLADSFRLSSLLKPVASKGEETAVSPKKLFVDKEESASGARLEEAASNAQKTDCVRDLVFGMVEDGTGNEDAVHVSEIDDTHPSASPSSSLVSSYCSSPTPEEDALFDFR